MCTCIGEADHACIGEARDLLGSDKGQPFVFTIGLRTEVRRMAAVGGVLLGGDAEVLLGGQSGPGNVHASYLHGRGVIWGRHAALIVLERGAPP